MNGNISQQGIKLDLEWMSRVGIGGFQNFDAAMATPLVVDHRVAYMTPEWRQDFLFATKLADQLGLEEAIAGSPGWSETGGPWVPPAEAMKKYVWSETRVQGGKPFTGTLIHPPTTVGPMQDIKGGDAAVPSFYADSAVIAFRAPANDVSTSTLPGTITSSSGSIDGKRLSDGDLNATVSLPRAAGPDKTWIQYEFPTEQTIQALTLVLAPQGRGEEPVARLDWSPDGEHFTPIVHVPAGGTQAHTLSFPAVKAKFFRIVFLAPKVPPNSPAAKAPVQVSELVLYAGPRVNRFEEKAGFRWLANQIVDLESVPTPDVSASDAIAKTDIVDLTHKMHPDGTLDWTPPAGEWVVMRFGYSLLGITNHPATKEATGLEVDKMNSTYVKHYMDHYLDSYEATVGADLMGTRGLRFVVTDSWEAGSQNWTDKMIAEFTKRRGYDPTPWMPVLAGRLVESSAASDRFLWDFRKTIADLIADDHYAQVAASLKERHMGLYGESHEGGRAFIGDGMEVKKNTSVPMGAMWVRELNNFKEQPQYNADDRESASVAHIYGQNLVAAESMTAALSPWAWSPATLKPTVDQEFLNGINRIVVHTSVHQPLVDKAPGLGLGIYGQWFNRNETWAEQAGPWVDYMARCSYMLQQGHFVADLVYFYGEDNNLTQIFATKPPNVPAEYGFDYINADALIHELSATDRGLMTKSGMVYRVLGLDPSSQQMSLPVLRSIYKLVSEGAVVAGPGPTNDPSLADDQEEFKKLTHELFGDGHSTQHVGKGTVYAGQNPSDVLHILQVSPDFQYSRPTPDTRLAEIHREVAGSDLYFVANRTDRDQQVDATFRVSGMAPELWHPETGASEPVSYKIANGLTSIPLQLEPWGSVFVVFRKPTKEISLALPRVTQTAVTTLDGPWDVSFEPNRGAPASAKFDTLMSWSDHEDPGIKYFSGVGTYTKRIDVTSDWLKAKGQLWLDLGDVKNLAQVVVNGKDLGIVWHAPYRFDVTQALTPGENEVVIKVTNAWVNRLIGDRQPGAKPVTFTVIKPYKADSPLLPSGLLGPVQLLRRTGEAPVAR